MRMKIISGIATACVGFSVLFLVRAAAPASAPEGQQHAQVAKKLVAAINADDQKAIQAMFDEGMRRALPEEKAREVFRSLLEEHGKITEVGEPRMAGVAGFVPLTCERGAWEMRLTLDPAGRISGLYFTDPPPAVPVPARNTMSLSLPVRGRWQIIWGGAAPQQNQHASVRNQRRALDLLMCDGSSRTYRNQGKRNEDYFCYGQPIYSPADGMVVTVIDGVPDNRPGSMNPYSAVGNCIVIRLSENEFCVMAHFQPHTMRVKEGERVKSGQERAKCGNSGNSSEPHLHFHLQNTQAMQDGTGFTAWFKDVKVTREKKTAVEKEYAPERGDEIGPAE